MFKIGKDLHKLEIVELKPFEGEAFAKEIELGFIEGDFVEVHDAAETLENDFSALRAILASKPYFILEVGFQQNTVEEHKAAQTLQETHQGLFLLFGKNRVRVQEFGNLEGFGLSQRILLQFLIHHFTSSANTRLTSRVKCDQ